ncbi:hypothetical protein [Rubellimicrobium aerolatum]|uniref:Chlorophyllide reductase n=1 Tax=Rubellimicrobium aerolatum TaxID=490979 RepID=A0ABW0S9I9_9RHOB|nr:hypothetical protein [Rubellimicrobium aerolatum]MBP1804970.1 hypothetical protein [Rubellimicrobium aerolatum]
MKPSLILLLGLLAAPALAQTSAEDARAQAVVLPMIEDSTQGMPGASEHVARIIAACVVAIATPEQRAALAAASGPSPELAAQVVTPLLSRPELPGCIEASARQ